MKVKVKDLHEGYWLRGPDGGRLRVYDVPQYGLGVETIAYVLTELGMLKFVAVKQDAMELEVEVELA